MNRPFVDVSVAPAESARAPRNIGQDSASRNATPFTLPVFNIGNGPESALQTASGDLYEKTLVRFDGA